MDEKIIKAKAGEDALRVGLSGKVVKGEVYEASREAQEILAAAQREAAAITEGAQREAEAVREDARQHGYQEGLARWNQALSEALEARASWFQQCEQELVRLAVRVAEKILGEHLRTDPTGIVSIVREALKSVGRERDLTIRVNPQHLEAVRARLDRLQEAVGSGRMIQVLPNPAVALGGCVVESELGVIDARLETQLQCLEEAMLRAGIR